MANNENNNGNIPENSAESIAARRKRREELKKRHKRNQMIFYGSILLVLVLIIVLISRSCSSSEDPANTDTVSPSPTASDAVLQLPVVDPNDEVYYSEQDSSTPAAPTNVSSIILTAVGDIMTYQEQINAALQSDGNYSFESSFTDIAKYTQDGDLTVGNLETTLSGSDVGYQGLPAFNAPEVLAKNLADVGFNVLSTANTYSLQHGIPGLVSTIQNVRGAGISTVGTYYSADDRKNSGVLKCEIDGISIAILAYTKGSNSIQVPAGYEYSVNFLYKDYYTTYSQVDTEGIIADIEAAKALETDLIMVMAHWGEEWSSTPNSSQTEIANLMFENGVDIIIGTHSHNLQPIEEKTVVTTDGETKDVFVCYSLGNFLSYKPDKALSSDSIILNLELIRDNTTGEVTIGDYDYIPIYISGPDYGFRIVDINQAIADYNAGNRGFVTDGLYSTLLDSLNSIHSSVGSERDRGVLSEYSASNSNTGTDDDSTIIAPPDTTDGDSGDTDPNTDPDTNPNTDPDTTDVPSI